MKTNPLINQVERRFGLLKLQRGVLLIEAMCAILIFSFGILGLIGLQTAAVQQSGDANFRSTAGELADQLINQMWISDRTTLNTGTMTTFQSAAPSGAAYLAWETHVSSSLPGGLATVTFPPQSSGCAAALTCTSVAVQVTISWQTSHDSAAHSYTVNAQISQ